MSKKLLNNRNKIDVSNIIIHSSKILKEFNNLKIIHLSDFHNNPQIMDEVIHNIFQVNPDFIFMTGDMINRYDTQFKYFFKLVDELHNRFPAYYIYGNHEKKLDEKILKKFIKYLSKNNVKIINNKEVCIYRNSSKINIYGLDIPLKAYYRKNKKIVKNIDQYLYHKIKSAKQSEFNIMLAHNPLFFECYNKYNIDLICCGHVHGGMINLPFIGGLLSPERKFFPQYFKGMYEENGSKMIVSRGLGHSRPGFRFMNNPELIVIYLKSNDKIK